MNAIGLRAMFSMLTGATALRDWPTILPKSVEVAEGARGAVSVLSARLLRSFANSAQARPGASICGDSLAGQKLRECFLGSGTAHHFRGVAVFRRPARGEVFPLLLKQQRLDTLHSAAVITCDRPCD